MASIPPPSFLPNDNRLNAIVVDIDPLTLLQTFQSNVFITPGDFTILQQFIVTTKYDASTDIPSYDYRSVYRGSLSLSFE
jgi:hypothetical protein